MANDREAKQYQKRTKNKKDQNLLCKEKSQV